MDHRIAVVAMGCCLPEAPDPNAFWQLISQNRSAIAPIPSSRWCLQDRQVLGEGDDHVRHRQGGSIRYQTSYPADCGFEPGFIARQDPLLAILLHAGWQAWLAAQPSPLSAARTGLILGQIALPNEACSRLAAAQLLGRPAPDLDPDARLVTGRPVGLLAQSLGLGGVVRSLDAACASGLYAVKLACDELLSGRADGMLAGGASRPDSLYTQMGFQALGALSRSGVCRPFDRRADGLVVGEGAALVVLKRLADARDAGDQILAEIHACGLSNDLGGSLFGPASEGQIRAMQAAYQAADWDPTTLPLLECHGTGTPRGDAVELASVRSVVGPTASPAVGSVKGNVGHLLTGAGAAGLLKTILALQHGQLPPSVACDQPSSELGNCRVLAQPEAWPEQLPRQAAVSAFGFGGINAHLLLAAPKASKPSPPRSQPREAIAIVGMDAWVGPWRGLEEVGPRLLGGGRQTPPAAPASWPANLPGAPTGWFCNQIELPLDRFRIPPAEMQDMSRQQALMLAVTAGAWDDAGLPEPQAQPRWGCCIGIDQDLAATRFHLRWQLRADGTNGDAAGGPLTANRVMGNLGGIVASRLARAFRLGGASFVHGNEDGSGLQALATAVELLQQGTLDLALVGAVSVQGDPRHLLDRTLPHTPSEGAIALVCKRLSDAEADGDAIYAVLEEGQQTSGTDALKRARLACGEGLAFMAESDGAESTWPVQSHWQRVGQLGAADGLIGLGTAALALANRIIPGPAGSHYWLRNRADGPRRAIAGGTSIDGGCCLWRLRQHDAKRQQEHPLGPLPRRLVELDVPTGRAAAWVDSEQRQADCHKRAQEAAAAGTAINEAELVYQPQPLGGPGRLCWIYPGSSNHFHGMLRELSAWWPRVLEQQDADNERHLEQFGDGRFWLPEAVDLRQTDRLFGQVWAGSAMTDILTRLSRDADAALGLSLGETASLFSQRIWTDRDDMLKRMLATPLFRNQLIGECTAARKVWQQNTAAWKLGLAAMDADQIRSRLLPKTYLLIIISPKECVIGGDPDLLDQLVSQLGCHFIELHGITSVHCEVARPVAEAYQDLHRLPCASARSTRIYSAHFGRTYPPSTEACSKSILGQALHTVDYPRVIRQAHDDGLRLFIEMGPANSCTRAIGSILADQPHVAVAASGRREHGGKHFMHALATLLANGEPINRNLLEAPWQQRRRPVSRSLQLSTPMVGIKDTSQKEAAAQGSDKDTRTGTPPDRHVRKTISANPVTDRHQPSPVTNGTATVPETSPLPTLPLMTRPPVPMPSHALSATARRPQPVFERMQQRHQTFLSSLQPVATPPAPISDEPPRALNREQCLAFAIGRIGDVLGPRFAAIDAHPTRVRLPDEPLMLVDRITAIEGEPCGMGSGRVVTEHDVLPGDWYLDGGVIPVSICVESGQADLFLSGFLGIDFITKGQAVYRLLDATITFHDAVPSAGSTIVYDIHVDGFFRQGDTYLFRFRFEGIVNGKRLLTMTDGIAGFFTEAELAAGQGVVIPTAMRHPEPGIQTPDFHELVPVSTVERYADQHLDALRRGDLAACFGAAFSGQSGLPCLPDGPMRLVHRILALEPGAGRHGLGRITGEADIHPDDWFLTCHFCDDMVMPGTLMYECCLHTLRVYLLRIGWVPVDDELIHEPVPGRASALKCRGQVLASTKRVQYELTIKEIGYDEADRPFCIADALMSGDGRPIVHMIGMSVRIRNLQRQQLETHWAARQPNAPLAFPPKVEFVPNSSLPGRAHPNGKPAEVEEVYDGRREGLTPLLKTAPIFDNHHIVAFAEGDPSAAFGEPYRMFDHERVIARLPRAPYKFLNRIMRIDGCQAFVMRAGGDIDAEYDVPPTEWYFAADQQTEQQPVMPFCVLLEAALQPCGWLSAYIGSALSSQEDLHYRNLGGTATSHRAIRPDSGTLRTRVRMTSVSQSGGMVIQQFNFSLHDADGPVYTGETMFGFFTKAALANQIGLRDAKPYQPDACERSNAESFTYPEQAPFPANQLRMLDRVSCYLHEGGPRGLGYSEGILNVDPAAWYFRAHFYQDPVTPGSLGLESFVQLLKVHAIRRWSEPVRFEALANGRQHRWLYRGQVLGSDQQVLVQCWITSIDEANRIIIGDGFLSVDGRIIYQMMDFALRMH